MVGASFLTAMSLTCMGLISVRLPTGQIRSVSLNSLVIADSGERKTGTDNVVVGPIYERDKKRAKKYEEDIVAYQTEMAIWESVKVAYLRDITQATRRDTLQAKQRVDAGAESVLAKDVWDLEKGVLDDAAQARKNDDMSDGGSQTVAFYREALAQHYQAKPLKPRLRRLIRQDITGRAIADAIEGDRELIALLSNEGDVVLRSDAMRQMGLLNSLWDGAGVIPFDRANGSTVAYNARGTVSLMVQEAVLKDYLDRRGNVVRGSGHWARYLVAWPVSTQGFRFMNFLAPEWDHLRKFHARLIELMDEYDHCREVGNLEPEVLEFDDDACASWIARYNNVERDLQPMQYLHDVKDFASKSMEIAGRIAALLHKFSKQPGKKITVDTFNRAWAFIEWHLHEFKRVFSPQQEVPVSQVQLDLPVLERYLLMTYWVRGYPVAPKNEALRNGPIRPKMRFDETLALLAAMGRIEVGYDQKRKGFIRMNAEYFNTLIR